MQQTLTLWQRYSKLKKSKGKCGIKIIYLCFILLVSLISFLTLIIINNSSQDWAESKKFYFVVVGENLSETSAKGYSKKIEELGGAGTILGNSSGNYSCVIFVYDDENSAEKIKKSAKDLFESSYIKCISTRKINKNIQSKLKNNSGIIATIEYLLNLNKTLKEYLFEFEKGFVSFSQLSKHVLKSKNEIVELKTTLNLSTSVGGYIGVSIDVITGIMDEFLNHSFKGDNDVLWYKKLCVQVALEIVEINQCILGF